MTIVFRPDVQMKLRTAFLKWLAEEDPALMADDGKAKLTPETMLAWKAWRAATAFAEAQKPRFGPGD